MRSGFRCASALAKCPPRECPTSAMRLPVRRWRRSTRSSSRFSARSEQSTLAEDVGGAGVVAHPLQPFAHDPERGVAGQEARDEDHRLAVAARDARPAVHGVHEQPGELRLPAQLAKWRPHQRRCRTSSEGPGGGVGSKDGTAAADMWRSIPDRDVSPTPTWIEDAP